MRECLNCHKYRGHNKKFCSQYCFKKYGTQNRRRQISPFLIDLEKRDKFIMEKKYRIAGIE